MTTKDYIVIVNIAPPPPTYNVTYDANGGSDTLPTDTNDYLEGAPVTVLNHGTLTNPGFSISEGVSCLAILIEIVPPKGGVGRSPTKNPPAGGVATREK